MGTGQSRAGWSLPRRTGIQLIARSSACDAACRAQVARVGRSRGRRAACANGQMTAATFDSPGGERVEPSCRAQRGRIPRLERRPADGEFVERKLAGPGLRISARNPSSRDGGACARSRDGGMRSTVTLVRPAENRNSQCSVGACAASNLRPLSSPAENRMAYFGRPTRWAVVQHSPAPVIKPA